MGPRVDYTDGDVIRTRFLTTFWLLYKLILLIKFTGNLVYMVKHVNTNEYTAN